MLKVSGRALQGISKLGIVLLRNDMGGRGVEQFVPAQQGYLRWLLIYFWQLSSFFFLSSIIIIIIFWEINVLGQSIIQPGEGGRSDVNSLPKINCSVGKGSQPLLACLRAIPSTH